MAVEKTLNETGMSSDTSGSQSVAWALFSLKGRIRRVTFGWGAALIAAYWWVAIAQVVSIGQGGTGYDIWLIALGFSVLIASYCFYALAHKRLHDFGYPGYYALAALAISFYLPFAIFIFVGLLAIQNGNPQVNNYGPPPVRQVK